MNNFYKVLLCATCLLAPTISAFSASPLAFPEALGFGANATGGRAGKVYHVTNLNDSGTGSFRDAVSSSNRIVVFDVSGYIQLESAVSINSNITIAGQTAPGEGIGIRGGEISCANRNNIIIRYLRVVPGSETASTKDDALSLYLAYNVILDHCSFEFAPWNNIDGVGSSSKSLVTDISFQNCLIANPTGQQFGAHCESVNSNWSWYYNAFVNSHNRNPLDKVNSVLVNNICYNNEASYTTHTSTTFSHDLVNNYFVYGPAASKNNWYQVDKNQKMYYSGNMLDTDKDGTLNGSVTTPYFYQGECTILSAPWSEVTTSNPIYSAETAFRLVTSQCGTLPYNDIDQQIWDEVRSLKNGPSSLYTTQATTGLANNGYGTIEEGVCPTDTDGDGMPDYWESANGLDNSKDDAMTIDDNGYANIEEYINFLGEPHTTVSGNSSVVYDLADITGGWSSISPSYTIGSTEKGTATVSGSKVTFTPTADYAGMASFTYTVKGSDGTSFTQKVNVCVIPSGTAVYTPAYPTLSKCGGGSSKQTVEAGTAISSFCYTWENANTVKVTWSPCAPDGITTDIDNTLKKVTFSGTPTNGGTTYNFTVTTNGSTTDSVCSSSGYIAVTGNPVMPVFIKRGGGSSSQTIELDSALSNYNFGWTVVPTITITWEPSAPAGIITYIDNDAKTIYFSGIGQERGTFVYTLTAANGDSVATRSGKIIIEGVDKMPVITKHGGGSSSQTVAQDSSISSFYFSWTEAPSIEISWEPSAPAGISTYIDEDSKEIEFWGTPTESGIYVYTLTAINGDSVATRSGTITVNAPAGMPIISKCGGGHSYQTVAPGTNIDEFCFTWTLANTVTITWEPNTPDSIKTVIDNATKTVTFSGTSTTEGAFTYTVTAINGDSTATRSQTLTFAEPTGLSNTSALCEGINLYPNPMRSHCTISVTATKAEHCELTLSSINGTEIAKDVISLHKGATEYEFDRGTLAPGIYFMNVKTSDRNQTLKVVIE